MKPQWINQCRDCTKFINHLKYKLGIVPTFAAIQLYAYYTYDIDAYRFAAMCMQVYANGRPNTFDDVPELYDEICEAPTILVFPLDNSK